jgi:type IV fimbrial biogenesis protein FimT
MLALTRSYPAKTQGFTLIELMVVIALIAIIAGLAAPDFQRMIARQRLNVTTSDLLVSVTQARGEAIKNNRQAIVQPLVSTDWSRGWRVYVDMNNDKAYTEGTDTLITTVREADSNILQYEAVRNNTVGNLIGFDSSGFVLGADAGRIVFSSSILGTSYRKGVVISRTGRARICTSQSGADGCAGAN